MAGQFSEYAQVVGRLMQSVVELESAAQMLQLAPLEKREWFELLQQKLIPQLSDDTFLVVAVVGGTNIGKSVVFNHLAGIRASSTSPLASGTKHPVCLVPPGFTKTRQLEKIFPRFQLVEWERSEAALETHAEHLLFWKTSDAIPENLLVLDTPDIDSDAEINWERADNIRHSADLLIAVLTQQKYNDAAVKRFFRLAAEEGKSVIVLFNQCELPDDEAYWSLWLETFCNETGIHPEVVYLAPNDRKAAEENRLPFYLKEQPSNTTSVSSVSVSSVTESATEPVTKEVPHNLTEDLSQYRFHEIKLQTLLGSLKHLQSKETGVSTWLNEIKEQSDALQSAATRLSSESLIRVNDWPHIAHKLLVAEVRAWWKQHQKGWAKTVNTVYDTVGTGIAFPFRFAKQQIQGPVESPIESYQKSEWSAILRVVEEVLDKLTWMSESGSQLLQPHFEKLLQGKSRVTLLDDLRRKHQTVNMQQELEEVVNEVMTSFQEGSPELYNFYKKLNTLSAAVRPVTSVVLFTLGWGPAGEVVAPFVTDAAVQTIVPLVADFTSGTVASIAGEQAVASAAGSSAGFLQAKFQKLQTTFTTRRANWLIQFLKEHLLGKLPEELNAAAKLTSSKTFNDVQSILTELQKLITDN
ncbi:ABC transporter [hydrothermal vent metagenome]|uniref:ABC transporter n=1 Tax=hydrothermal vent metagenome TaxID=652676 RepID=A0A3B1DQC7_9ZZZZ